jgi:glycosyltransferase involved in cell wall biosynthesis
MYPELARCAARESADLYIGHYPAGLAAAAHAAGTHDALLGYDVEDFHVGERPDDEDRIRRIDFIERRYLPECAYVTAASEGIAEAVAERYHVPTPVVVYNTFPKTERSALNGEVNDRDGEALSLYWYSQTIGLDRGIQDAIRAAGRLDVPVQLHVRGSLSDEVRRTLTSLAEESGGAETLYFHEKVPPDELLARAAEHDVGLALEQGHTPNRKICTTNKLFRYMLAGLAIAATDVPGQRTVLGDESAFSGLYPPGDAEALAGILRQWTDRNRLNAAQSAALRAARERWNWETESQKLIDTVNALFD